MNPEDWKARWREGRIGFHMPQVHPSLLQVGEAFLAGGHAVLVPLCGKSLDLPWLAARLPTLGVELSPDAVAQLHDEQGLTADIHEHGAYRAWRSGALLVLEGDVFDLDAAHLTLGDARVDRVWDRAAMVALDPQQRARYVALLRALLPSGAQILLETFSYNPAVMSGPPHSVPEEEIAQHYAGCKREVLEVRDELEPRWRAAGHTWWHHTLQRITLP